MARRLPNRVLVDTGVLIRALGQHPDDPRTPACQEFFRAMLATDRTMLIAAPTVAEMLRHSEPTPVPRVKNLFVVAFDQMAAEMLGRSFPMKAINAIKASGDAEASGSHIKYDAMIIACGLRATVECVVSIDGKQFRRMCKSVGLPCFDPSHFSAPQLPLFVAEN